MKVKINNRIKIKNRKKMMVGIKKILILIKIRLNLVNKIQRKMKIN